MNGVHVRRKVRPLHPAHEFRSPWLIPAPGGAQVYPPLRRGGLLGAFVRLGGNPSLEGIRKFASRYGFLTSGYPIREGRGGIVFGEPVSEWIVRLLEMRHRVELLSAITAFSPGGRWQPMDRRQAESLLRSRFFPAAGGEWLYAVELEYPDFATAWFPAACPLCARTGSHMHQRVLIAGLKRRADSKDDGLPSRASLVRAARAHLTAEINAELRAGIDLLVSTEGDGLRLRYAPRDLLRSIYFALALEVVGDTAAALRECANPRCREARVFTARRRDQRYCGKRCREIHYYHRRRAAQSDRNPAPGSSTT